MKKVIFILMLCVLQGACAHYGAGGSQGSSLLTYEQLGGEITVTRISVEEDMESPEDLEAVVAASR